MSGGAGGGGASGIRRETSHGINLVIDSITSGRKIVKVSFPRRGPPRSLRNMAASNEKGRGVWSHFNVYLCPPWLGAPLTQTLSGRTNACANRHNPPCALCFVNNYYCAPRNDLAIPTLPPYLSFCASRDEAVRFSEFPACCYSVCTISKSYHPPPCRLHHQTQTRKG